MNGYVLVAGILTIMLGIAHSVMGELKIISRMKTDKLPVTQGSTRQTKRTLRLAWHVTSVLGFGIGALLIVFATRTNLTNDELIAIRIFSVTMFTGFLVSVITSRGKHPSWFVLLVIALLLAFSSL